MLRHKKNLKQLEYRQANFNQTRLLLLRETDMIKYTTGNMLESKAQALVNTVNTEGVMGKGIALQFKKAFPENFKSYKKACENKEIGIGNLLLVKDQNISSGQKLIINFPTKQSWRKPSEYAFIEKGLDDLKKVLKKNGIESIAIPPLGSGNGGLDWCKVKQMIESKLSDLDIDIIIYEPSTEIKEHLKKERVKLTDARALLLDVLYDLVKHGEYVSEFSSEKVCYFLQRFGAKDIFKLNFQPNFYGPYSGKIRYVLNYLNGSYVMGYSDMNKRPFEPLLLIPDGYETVQKYIKNKPELQTISEKAKTFLNGFYSDFALELLSTIDFVSSELNICDRQEVSKALESWSDRKRSLFSNKKYIDISIEHLSKTDFS